ncbi:MAG: hypothetical protein HY700_01130 [Gemmatimonadetes bacterium]|nr:hypothetical protein [Gemmatimonadota bacterium]
MEINAVRGARYEVRGIQPFRAPRTAHRTPWWLLAVLLAGAPLQAQSEAARANPWFVSVSHYGRWVALAAAGGMLTEAAVRHGNADREYANLVDLCRNSPPRCNKATDGSYLDGETEALYQHSVALDHDSRAWLLGGELTILTAGTMFVLDLVYHDDGPKNIPFSPFSIYAKRGQVGLTVRF